MSLANRVQWYLDHHHIDYEVVHHPHATTAYEAGLEASVPPGRVAKCVLLEDERGYVLAVLPAACRLSFAAIRDVLHRRLELASEQELEAIFGDCEPGAVPILGSAYNVPMLVEEALLRMPDLYFEGGDHEDLVHVDAAAFRALMEPANHGRFAHPH